MSIKTLKGKPNRNSQVFNISKRASKTRIPSNFESTMDIKLGSLIGLRTGSYDDLIKLGRNQCRYPIENNFCGNKSVDGKPYCEEHCRIAYTKGQPRKV
jgi:hypothetical protein